LFSNTCSLCPLNVRSSCKPIQNHRQNYSFVYSDFMFERADKKSEGSGLNLASVIRSHSPLNFLQNQVMICYCYFEISEMCDIFKRSVSCCCLMVSLIWQDSNMSLVFTVFTSRVSQVI
jgi:hypothetical protein